jgi:hypothetical protein
MKTIMIMLICLASTFAVYSQDSVQAKKSAHSNEMNTLFKKGNGHGNCKIPLGYFIEMNGGYSQFGGKGVFLPGMSMGIILNHHWTIGATGSFIGDHNGMRFNNVYYDSATMNMHSAKLNGGYGGLLLEYTLLPRSKVHIAFPLMIGYGSMYYSNSTHHGDSAFFNNSHHDWRNSSWHRNSISSDGFFVVEPGVRLEFNVIKALRIGLGISYRYTPDLKFKNTTTPADLINQFTARLGIRLGKF